ncbi:hypothetical protein GX50_01434 [[Emmonsia] crescens]|uniref:Acid ceramidase N-terminal domain-containing protein n=1 Tax=[Emmonsia] crescens TaxID=73230 RepID=A0A2B7ZQR9_9EURO|nr:hypothetical protein GX50_01434 [Emmonsia crescens]
MADPVRPTDKNNGDSPLVYRIDLSLPPAQRYVELAGIYREKMRSLTSLFDELVKFMFPGINIIWVKKLNHFIRRKACGSIAHLDIKLGKGGLCGTLLEYG